MRRCVVAVLVVRIVSSVSRAGFEIRAGCAGLCADSAMPICWDVSLIHKRYNMCP